MSQNILPEERLFKVIQEAKSASSENKNYKQKFKLQFPSKLKAIFLNPFAPKSKSFPKQTMSIQAASLQFRGWIINLINLESKSAHRFFFSLLIASLMFFVFIAVNKPNAMKLIKLNASITAPFKNLSMEDLKPLAVYVGEIRKRDIFRPVAKGSGISLQGPTMDLAVVGIYSQDNYSEVIMEDKAMGKNYFLKVGDEIKGMKIKSILSDRVILQCGEEEMELM